MVEAWVGEQLPTLGPQGAGGGRHVVRIVVSLASSAGNTSALLENLRTVLPNSNAAKLASFARGLHELV